VDEKSVDKNHGVIVPYVLISYNEIDDVITHSLFCVSSLKISTPKNMSIANLLERWEGGPDIWATFTLEMDECYFIDRSPVYAVTR